MLTKDATSAPPLPADSQLALSRLQKCAALIKLNGCGSASSIDLFNRNPQL
jgi:hypothetical protein